MKMEVKIICKIKKIMEFENINQRQLAQKIGLTPVAISRYLSGNRKLTIEFVIKISNAFNVSLDWLLKDENK